MVENDIIYVYWGNPSKASSSNEVCRVIFFNIDIEKQEYWLLERDIYWPGDNIYDIHMEVVTKLTTIDGRKLWKILVTKHNFYKQEINETLKENIKNRLNPDIKNET